MGGILGDLVHQDNTPTKEFDPRTRAQFFLFLLDRGGSQQENGKRPAVRVLTPDVCSHR